jgi:hypothetical protein
MDVTALAVIKDAAIAQFRAVLVLDALIPFFLALLAVGAAIWALVNWVYETRLRKAKLDIDWARLEIERFKLRRDELISENQIKEQKIADLEKEKASLSQAGQNALAELAASQERTDLTLANLDETTDRLESNLDAGSASTGGLLELLPKDEVARERRVDRRQRKIERQKRAKRKRDHDSAEG